MPGLHRCAGEGACVDLCESKETAGSATARSKALACVLCFCKCVRALV
jgi:hypothetical protein